MHEIWELIEQRRDGRWYTLQRSDDAGAWRAYSLFVDGNPSRTLTVRRVLDTDPELSGVSYPFSRESGNGQKVTVTMRNDPYSAGQNLGKALGAVFLVQASPSAGDVFNLGWTFAKLCGYVAADDAKEFTEGFAQGLSSVNSPKAIPGA